MQKGALAPSKKYRMIEEFKDKLKNLKNILNEVKKTRIIKRTRNINKKWYKKKVKYARWWNKQYLGKLRRRFNDFNTKMLNF